MPEQLHYSDNAAILRLRINKATSKDKGFALDWEESES